MRLWSLVFVSLLGVAVLLSLGIWQLKRLNWKESVLAEIELRVAAPPIALLPLVQIDSDVHNRQTMQVTGRYTDQPFVRVLVSRRLYGAGYRIIQPFVTTAGRSILVDRGYVKVDQTTIDIPTGDVTLTGNLYWPDEIDRFTPDNNLAKNIWYSRDVAVLADFLDTEPVFLVLRSSVPKDDTITQLPIGTKGIPNNHLEYAITWFSLALIWLVMTGNLLYRQRKAM